MKKYKKLILLLLVIILLSLLTFIAIKIYAKYLTTADGNAQMKIANWNIKVNDLSIKNNTDISNTIVPIFPGNDNIAENIIAPTAEGYFDLNFDFTGADVSFTYKITTSVNENSSVKDLVATGYSIDDGLKINFENYNDNISDTILLDDNIDSRKIRIYIMWNDDENTSQMNNEEDTQATKSDIPALFNVNISFTQIAN